MAVRQDKDNKKKSLKSLLKEKDKILIEHPEVIDDERFASYRPPQASKLINAYKRYNQILDEIEKYVNQQNNSNFKPRK